MIIGAVATNLELQLAEAFRQVAECEQRVLLHKELLEQLRWYALPTDKAEDLLMILERSLSEARKRLDDLQRKHPS